MKSHIIFIIILLVVATSCGKSFLERNPKGELTDPQVLNTKAVEWDLIGAYGLLNGNKDGTWGNYASAPSQWLFGEVAADDAHKGSENSDQALMNDIELHRTGPVNEHLSTMWNNYFEGVIRCNTTIRHLKEVQQSAESKFSQDRATVLEAEARMLRAHYYFYLWRVFKNIPYIDETTATTDAASSPNNVDVFPKIIEDLVFAEKELPVEKPLGEIGRVDKMAAKAYLGKAYLYDKKYDLALPLFKEVIASRPNLVGIPFQNNFDINTENGPESIFAVQHAINPNGSGDNANVGDMLSGFYGDAPVSCCGFYRPTFDLVNAFKVTTSGLPMLDNSYRADPYKSDFGLSGSAKSDYEVDKTIAFDPRIDYTVGRRGVPFRDWGIMPGDNWLREPSSSGPFVVYKQMIDKADFSGNTANGEPYITGLNVNIIRLADVYLMAAECAAETGDLKYAFDRVNDVRKRAATLPPVKINGENAAAYNVKPYTTVFTNKEAALSAIRFERRIELALEGHRFFDLVRWGIAKQVLESYSDFEGGIISFYKGLNFEEKDNYFPIPQDQIDRSGGALTQNEGY